MQNNLNKFNAQEFSSEKDRKQRQLTTVTRLIKWYSDLKQGMRTWTSTHRIDINI